ncbi:MAG TPA: DUF4377 domain-containing protein [Gemmatimonadales bacterium]|nr:DUF4377 domain-containing protein [Gemmatimonadales bacterium]
MARPAFVLAAASAISACGVTTPESPRRTLVVQHHMAECFTVNVFRCYLAREPGATDFSFMSTPIEGFTYEWGNVYELEVEEHVVNNPPMDGSAIRLELVAERSRTRVPAGTEFSVVLSGGQVVESTPGVLHLGLWPAFTCGEGQSCDGLRDMLEEGKRVEFRFAHPASAAEPLKLVSWSECASTVPALRCGQ